ncbi:very long chain fatty acid elongase AAEL008004 isoform X2 [Halyomorpha halys]|uniref:very long chain fatty acid elongase AAEL008004 isoform X2 n=1 Tax=Halyomorpha halys TaxID=286706 RepID=UPI0006D51EE8|nr:elongation of very long chain fatty acids protein AAEL008004-like isoform X2 [Halyomorpha halys]
MDVGKYFSLNYVKKFEPRIEDHFPKVFASLDHVLWILTAYFLFIMIGQRMMYKRKPLKLTLIMPLYNFLQVMANIYLAQWVVKRCSAAYGVFGVWNNICHPIGKYIDKKTQIDLVKLMMYYYLNKVSDLMDTVFLILRKKQSQVTFLHLFHHSTMVVSSWITIAYFRENICIIFGLINMVVHFFMYTYYFLSSFGPKMQKYLFWKKLLTIMQLVQFMIMVALLLKMSIYNCRYDVVFWRIWIFNVLIFMGLFLNFYERTYKIKKKRG